MIARLIDYLRYRLTLAYRDPARHRTRYGREYNAEIVRALRVTVVTGRGWTDEAVDVLYAGWEALNDIEQYLLEIH